MYSKKITIVNPTGLHARPASQVCSKAADYSSEIKLQRVGEEDLYDVKSIINLLVLGLSQGEEAILSAEGADEIAAVDELAELIASFDE